MHWRDWTPRLVSATHEAGLMAFGWDAQTEAAVRQLIELNIDAIYADRPDLLVARAGTAGSSRPR
jgi:glycerophosphoryl diester phosphodiesterase